MATKAPARAALAKRSASRTVVTTNGGVPTPDALKELLRALTAARDGDFSVRLPVRRGTIMGEIAAAYNRVAETNARQTKEFVRVARVIGREGRMTERLSLAGPAGAWASGRDSINSLIDDLVRPTTERSSARARARMAATMAESWGSSPRPSTNERSILRLSRAKRFK